MSPRAMLRATVVMGGLTAVVVTGCATGGGAPTLTADQAIEKRKALMKEQGGAWRNIQDKAKAGQVAAIVSDAEKLAMTSKEIPTLFPEGSLAPEKSAAKPEIWQRRAEFDAAAKNLESWSVRLRDAAKANNTEQTQAIVKDFGRQACGTCHQPFRVPPKQ
jgi:cytochrome c556